MRTFNGAMRPEDRVRLFLRTGRNSGVSVGMIGGLILLILVAAFWSLVAVQIGAVLMGAVLALAAAYVSALWLCERLAPLNITPEQHTHRRQT
jgi:hypothetical protein